MKISDIIEMSILNLWRRRVRTFLTVLGVIIGTASIVVMVSIGVGMQRSLMQMEELSGGLKEIAVYSEDGGSDEKLLSDETVTKFKEMEFVKDVQPQLMYTMPIQIGRYESMINLIGVSDDYLKEIELEKGELPQAGNELQMIMGNMVSMDFYDTITGDYPFWGLEDEDDFFDDDDDEEEQAQETSNVPQVDWLKEQMYGGIEKQEVDTSQDSTEDDKVKGDPSFAVTADDPFGTGGNGDEDADEDDENGLSSDFSFSDYDESYDTDNYSAFTSDMKRVPLKISGITTGGAKLQTVYSYNCYTKLEFLKDFLKKNYGPNEIIPEQPTDRSGKPYRDLKYNYMIVTVDRAENVESVLETIQDMGYHAESNKDWLEQTQQTSMLIEAVLGGIGAVSMLVAAISIANTMTMSIYERTKEIGVMKVLGCGLASIRSMFLTEAAVIGFLGGVVGVGLSFIISMVLNRFAPQFVSGVMDLMAGMKISVIPIWLVGFSVLFSTLIGMVAGFFPAQRATRLSPLAAIRNE